MSTGSAGAVDIDRRFLRMLQAVNLSSALDRFAIAPMLLVLAADLDASVSDVTLAASAYFLLYGLMQPIWGLVTARVGTIRTLRIALMGAGVVGLLSALAPTVSVLVLLRGIAGAFFGGAIPATLVYVGDAVPVERRQGPLTDLMAGVAVGTALATVAAGWTADLLTWRWVFAATAATALALAVYFGRREEPGRRGAHRTAPGALSRAVRDPWTGLVLALGFVEGAAITGALTFVAPAIQHAIGGGPGVPGTVVAAYGVAVLLFSRLVGPLSARWATPLLLLIGGSAGTLGFGVLALHQGVTAGLSACVLLGAAWAFLHSTLQVWATSVAPDARAQVVAVFVGCLFLGGAAGAVLGGALADGAAYELLFGMTAAVFASLTGVAALTRRRYLRTRPGR